MDVRRISEKDTYPIRQQILFPDREVADAKIYLDEDEQSFHLGAFVDSKLVSVASFYLQRHPRLVESYQYRLQGMATLTPYQNQGLSQELLKMAFPIIKQNLCEILWCEARISATGFYQKAGFEKLGSPYTIAPYGEHQLMYRKI